MKDVLHNYEKRGKKYMTKIIRQMIFDHINNNV